MKRRPSDIVEEELRAAGYSWTVRINKHNVYTIRVPGECMMYTVTRNCNKGRTMENTRAGIRRLIRDLNRARDAANLSPVAQSDRNGERHESIPSPLQTLP